MQHTAAQQASYKENKPSIVPDMSSLFSFCPWLSGISVLYAVILRSHMLEHSVRVSALSVSSIDHVNTNVTEN